MSDKVRNVASMGGDGVWCGDLTEREHLEDLSVDVNIKLKLTLKYPFEREGIGLVWFRIGIMC
jgi:hypothetical protein